jgi:hypothetical protein
MKIRKKRLREGARSYWEQQARKDVKETEGRSLEGGGN